MRAIVRLLPVIAVALSASVVVAQTISPPTPSPTPTPYRSNPVDTAHGDREFLLLWPDGAPGAMFELRF